MSKVLLHLHLGLGDHLICNAIVRKYCEKYDNVTIFAKPQNYASVVFMFRDLKNLTIIEGNDDTAKKIIFWNNLKFGNKKYSEIKTIGFKKLNHTSNEQFEKQFYKLAMVDFDEKWNSFYFERDPVREKNMYDMFAPKNDYAFIHEDVQRNYVINRNKVNKDLVEFTPKKEITPNFFDYSLIIEKAKEIHVIDSSFMFLIDALTYSNPHQKLFVHRYARKNPEWQLPILKKNWVILE